MDEIKIYIFWYLVIFVLTLLLNAFICGLFKHRLTFKDYLDSFLFPVTYIYLLGVTISGLYNSVVERYKNTKKQLNAIKEQETLKKMKEQNGNSRIH